MGFFGFFLVRFGVVVVGVFLFHCLFGWIFLLDHVLLVSWVNFHGGRVLLDLCMQTTAVEGLGLQPG